MAEHDYPSWEWLVESWGYQIDFQEVIGSYQGDFVFGLRDGDRYGFVVIGYGSCSGCDALEAAVYSERWSVPAGAEWLEFPEVKYLSDQMKASVRWSESLEARSLDIQKQIVDGTDYWRRDIEVCSALRKLTQQEARRD